MIRNYNYVKFECSLCKNTYMTISRRFFPIIPSPNGGQVVVRPIMRGSIINTPVITGLDSTIYAFNRTYDRFRQNMLTIAGEENSSEAIGFSISTPFYLAHLTPTRIHQYFFGWSQPSTQLSHVWHPQLGMSLGYGDLALPTTHGENVTMADAFINGDETTIPNSFIQFPWANDQNSVHRFALEAAMDRRLVGRARHFDPGTGLYEEHQDPVDYLRNVFVSHLRCSNVPLNVSRSLQIDIERAGGLDIYLRRLSLSNLVDFILTYFPNGLPIYVATDVAYFLRGPAVGRVVNTVQHFPGEANYSIANEFIGQNVISNPDTRYVYVDRHNDNVVATSMSSEHGLQIMQATRMLHDISPILSDRSSHPIRGEVHILLPPIHLTHFHLFVILQM
uniref:Uncharacterized protein n=1 Tax=Phalansterium sp. PJK-2012 TaxID=1267188 RepID=T1QDV7_9EUKA|nr:hypothetical protein [Phalansterium sp. PJK-2012]